MAEEKTYRQNYAGVDSLDGDTAAAARDHRRLSRARRRQRNSFRRDGRARHHGHHRRLGVEADDIGSALVGPALTVRNIVQREHIYEAARRHVNKMAEFEAHNLALPGDVVVIDGVAGISNMGGISAQTGKRRGEAGAIVFGGVRDVAHSRRVAYAVWATEFTPVTGKWRIETVEINGAIVVAGIRVAPGEIVLADDSGVCFIPRAKATEVLELAKQKSAAEEAKCKAIDSGVPVADLPG